MVTAVKVYSVEHTHLDTFVIARSLVGVDDARAAVQVVDSDFVAECNEMEQKICDSQG